MSRLAVNPGDTVAVERAVTDGSGVAGSSARVGWPSSPVASVGSSGPGYGGSGTAGVSSGPG